MTHDTYLPIFGDHGVSPIYHYPLFEHVWFIYVSILLNKLSDYYVLLSAYWKSSDDLWDGNIKFLFS